MKFSCENCSHTWSGKSLEERASVRNNKVRCPSCNEWQGIPAEGGSDTVSSGKPGEGATGSALGSGADLPDAAAKVQGYNQLLDLVNTSQDLESGLQESVGGGGSDISDIVQVLKLRILSDAVSGDSSDSVSEIQSQLRDLRSEFDDLKSGSSEDTLQDRVLDELISSWDLQQGGGGLDGDDLSVILDRFENSNPAPKNGLGKWDAEARKHEKEAEARKYEADRHGEAIESLADAIKGFANDLGFQIGSAFAQGGPRSNPQSQSSQPQNPSSGKVRMASQEIEERSETVEVNSEGWTKCPECDLDIKFPSGSSRVVCPSCQQILTRLTKEEMQEGVEVND